MLAHAIAGPLEILASCFQNFGMSLHVLVSLWLQADLIYSERCPFIVPECPQADGPAKVIFSLLALKRTFLYQTWVFSRMPASNSSFIFVFL
jgi:hypothetical protein